MNDDIKIHLTRPQGVETTVWDDIRAEIAFFVTATLEERGIGYSYQDGQLRDEGYEPEESA